MELLKAIIYGPTKYCRWREKDFFIQMVIQQTKLLLEHIRNLFIIMPDASQHLRLFQISPHQRARIIRTVNIIGLVLRMRAIIRNTSRVVAIIGTQL